MFGVVLSDAARLQSCLPLDHTHLASVQASGLRVAFGTPAKSLQVGQAAANGLSTPESTARSNSTTACAQRCRLRARE